MNDDSKPRRSPGAITFDLVLIGFTLLIVVTSLSLRPGVGSVPLLVGVPTLLALVVILATDLVPRSTPTGPAADPNLGAAGAILGLVGAAETEEAVAMEPADEPQSRPRQLAFTAWTIGFVILAAVTSFYIAVPAALVVILAAIRLRWPAIVLITAGTLAGFYGLFDLFLRVRL